MTRCLISFDDGAMDHLADDESPRRRRYAGPPGGSPAGRRLRTAPRIARKISSGGGGQPGTVASTGITFATLPQLA
jgi:hypothetical protein